MLNNIGEFCRTPNGRLVLFLSCIFLFYLVVIVCFALVYLRMYRRRPSCFVFASRIEDAQLANKSSEIQNHVNDLAGVEQVLSSVSAYMQATPKGRVVANAWRVVTPEGVSIDCFAPEENMGGTLIISDARILVRDEVNRRDIWQWIPALDSFGGYETDILFQEVEQQRATISAEISQSHVVLASLKRTSTQIWTFADFLYFSVIIQSTVGLGDIQPSSTPIRRIVITQILSGYAILILFAKHISLLDFLRAYPGSLDSWRGICSKSPEHDTDHCDAEKCSNGRGVAFEVASQATVTTDPRERSFDDPPFG